jgi:hypothetical protein
LGPNSLHLKEKEKVERKFCFFLKITKFDMLIQWENYLQFQIEEQAHLSSGQSYEPLPALADQPDNMPKKKKE